MTSPADYNWPFELEREFMGKAPETVQRRTDNSCFLSIRFPYEGRLEVSGTLLDGIVEIAENGGTVAVTKLPQINAEVTPPERLHLTLLYADECSDEQLAMFLANLSPTLPFSIEVVGLKLLQVPEGGQVLVWSIDPGPALARLQSELFHAVAVEDMQVSEFSRPSKWVPHITVAHDYDNMLHLDDLPEVSPFRLMVNSFTIGRNYDDYFEVHLPRGVGDRQFVEQHHTSDEPPAIEVVDEGPATVVSRGGMETEITVRELAKLVHGGQIMTGVLRRAVGLEGNKFVVGRVDGTVPGGAGPTSSGGGRGTGGSKQDGSKVGMKKQETGFNPDGRKRQFGMDHHQPVTIDIEPDLKELLEAFPEWDGGAEYIVEHVLLDSGTSESGREGDAYDEEISPKVVEWFDNVEATDRPLTVIQMSEMSDMEIQIGLDAAAATEEGNRDTEPKKNQSKTDARGRKRSYMFGRNGEEIVAVAMATLVDDEDYRLGILESGALDALDLSEQEMVVPHFQPDNYEEENFETGFIYIDWLAVKTPQKGYGSQMLGEIFRQAASDGRGVFLEANKSATEFYTRFRANATTDDTIFWTAEEVEEWVEIVEEESLAITGDEEEEEIEEKSLVKREDLNEVLFGADDPKVRPYNNEEDHEPVGGDYTMGNVLWIEKPRPWKRQFAEQIEDATFMSDEDAAIFEAREPEDQRMPDERETMLQGVQRALDNLVSKIFKRRHGQHEAQEGVEGQRGGSAAGFTHVGATPEDESGGGSESDTNDDFFGNYARAIDSPTKAKDALLTTPDDFNIEQTSKLLEIANQENYFSAEEADQIYRDSKRLWDFDGNRLSAEEGAQKGSQDRADSAETEGDRKAEFTRLSKVLDRIMGERMDVSINPEDRETYEELREEMSDWQEGADGIVDSFLGEPRVYGGDVDTEDTREIDYDVLSEMEMEYYDNAASGAMDDLTSDYDAWVEGYYEVNGIDNWADLEVALMEDFDLTEQQVRSMGSQELHNLVGDQAAIETLVENGFIEEGEYEHLADVGLPSGGDAGGDYGDSLRSPGEESRPPTQVSEMFNSVAWDYAIEQEREGTTMQDLEDHFGGLPRIGHEDGESSLVETEGDSEVSFKDGQHSFIGRENGEIVAILSATVVQDHYKTRRSSLEGMISNGTSRNLGLSDEETMALEGQPFVTLNYLAAKNGGAGHGTEMILRGLKLAADNNAGIIGNSVPDAAPFYDKLGARWWDPDGPQNGGPALFTPQDVKSLVGWLESSGLDIDNLSGDEALAGASMVLRFSPDEVAEAIKNDPAAHFTTLTRASSEKKAIEDNNEWVDRLDAARPMKDILQKRHGKHEGQAGRDGEKGGSQEGFTHAGAESDGGDSNVQTEAERSVGSQRWDDKSLAGGDGQERVIKFYHGTSEDLVDEITSVGLLRADDNEGNPEAVYFSTAQKVAELYGYYSAEDEGEVGAEQTWAVIEFEVPEDAAGDVLRDGVPESWKLEQDIPPEWIKKVHFYENDEIVKTVDAVSNEEMTDLEEGGSEAQDFETDSGAATNWLREHFTASAKSMNQQDINNVAFYKVGGYEDINNVLRGEETAFVPLDDADVQGYIEGIDSIMQRTEVPEAVVAYRGMDLEDQFNLQFEELEGETFTFDGYTSTSLDRTVASDFAAAGTIGKEEEQPPVLLSMTIPAGIKGFWPESDQIDRASTVGIAEEQELLLDRGLQFTITDTETIGDLRIMHVDVVPGSGVNQSSALGLEDQKAVTQEKEELALLEMEERADHPMSEGFEKDEDTSQEDDTSENREDSENSEVQEDDRSGYWIWEQGETKLLDRRDVEGGKEAGDRQAEEFSREADPDAPTDQPVFALVPMDSEPESEPEEEEEEVVERIVVGPLRRVVIKHGKHVGQEGNEGTRGGSAAGFTHEEGSVDSDPTSSGGKAGVTTDRREVEASEFQRAFEVNMKDDPRAPYVTAHSPEDLENMTTYLSADGMVGFAVKDHGNGDIEATQAFNGGSTPGAFLSMLKESVAKDGVNYVEAFAPLHRYYERAGFVVDTESDWDPDQAPDNWSDDLGKPKYYTMRIGKSDGDD